MLQHNLLTTIDGLEFFAQLKYLVVSHNSLTEVSGVSHLQSLQYLDASHNRIEHAPDARVLPDALMALELTANPCAEAEGYRARLVDALPRLLFLDDVRISDA